MKSVIFSFNIFDFHRVCTPILIEWSGVAVLCCHGKNSSNIPIAMVKRGAFKIVAYFLQHGKSKVCLQVHFRFIWLSLPEKWTITKKQNKPKKKTKNKKNYSINQSIKQKHSQSSTSSAINWRGRQASLNLTALLNIKLYVHCFDFIKTHWPSLLFSCL